MIESTQLSDLRLKDRRGLWNKFSIWRVAGAIVFRVTTLSEDLDGSPRAYHPPTDASWNGFGRGLAKDSLANAVGVPGVTAYAHSKNESDWALTAGCQLFRDLHQAKQLEPKAAVAAPPAAQILAPPPPAPDKVAAATDAKNKLDAIFKKYGVTKLSELETKKSIGGVCVVRGRPPESGFAEGLEPRPALGGHPDQCLWTDRPQFGTQQGVLYSGHRPGLGRCRETSMGGAESATRPVRREPHE